MNMKLDDNSLECLVEAYNVTVFEAKLEVLLENYYAKKETENATVKDIEVMTEYIKYMLDSCDNIMTNVNYVLIYYNALKDELENEKMSVYSEDL